MDEAAILRRVHALLVASLDLWEANHILDRLDETNTLVVRRPSGEVVATIGLAPKALRNFVRWTIIAEGDVIHHCSSVLGLLDDLSELLHVKPEGMAIRLSVTGATS